MEVHQCRCPHCLTPEAHPDQELHHWLNVLHSRLDEHERRWLAGLESQKHGHGGDRLLSRITGLHVETIRRGRRELEAGLRDCPPGRVRRPGSDVPP